MFNLASGVKEIQTVKTLVTTTGEREFTYRTTFEESGEPIEIAIYNKDGKIEKTEPWVRAKEGEFEGSKVKQEFDKNKRLIKSTTYNNGVITYQVQYKYDALGNKIEAYDKDKKIAYKYLNALLNEEITFNKAEDNQFYWYGKKKFKYDEKFNLAEMLVLSVYDLYSRSDTGFALLYLNRIFINENNNSNYYRLLQSKLFCTTF